MASINSELSTASVDGQRKDLLGPQMRKTRLCQFHMQGNCMYGDRCTFAHEIQELQSAPDLRKTRICQAYMMGGCNKESCNFAHGLQELRSTDFCYKTSLCMWHSKGKCMNGSRCRFAHGHKELRHQQAEAEAMALARQREIEKFTRRNTSKSEVSAPPKSEEDAQAAALEKLKAFLEVRVDEGLSYDEPLKVETASIAPTYHPTAKPEFYKAGKESAARSPDSVGARTPAHDSLDSTETEALFDPSRLRAWALLQQKIKEVDLPKPEADVRTRYNKLRAPETNEVPPTYGLIGHSPSNGITGAFDVGMPGPYNRQGLGQIPDTSTLSLKEFSELAKNLSLLSSQASYLDGVVRGMEIGMKTGMANRKAPTWQPGPPGLGGATFQCAQV
mmetsp:Transcript_97605/g.172874  ORF Transcript_97605/g.172874 Transcript_97605/m.172874 type:complete len:389 (-) Transcript_97605:132-1298(-)